MTDERHDIPVEGEGDMVDDNFVDNFIENPEDENLPAEVTPASPTVTPPPSPYSAPEDEVLPRSTPQESAPPQSSPERPVDDEMGQRLERLGGEPAPVITPEEFARLQKSGQVNIDARGRVRTARRDDAEAGVSLRKRRAWYTPE